MFPLCRHCCRRKANRCRSLCWHCYYTPGLRNLYPTHPKYGRRGRAADNTSPPLPGRATIARPGSGEKVAELEARVAFGLGLWHPEDITIRSPERLLDVSIGIPMDTAPEPPGGSLAWDSERCLLPF